MSDTTTPPSPSREHRRRAAADRQRARNAEAPAIPTTVPWRAVAVFAAVSVGLAWLVQLPVWLSGEGLASPLFTPLTLVMMFTPAVAALVAVRVQRPAAPARMLGLVPIRPAWRTFGFAAAMLVALPLISFAALALGQVLGFVEFDFSFAALAQLLESQGGQPVPPELLPTLAIVSLIALPVNSLVTSVATFGEELGWRGWLLPALRPLGTWPALVLSGAFWGLWHTPVILLGYNFGVTDASGVLFMTIACVFLGVLLGWTRLRTASVWPAVLAHGAINTATPLFLVTFLVPEPGSVHGTILGVAGWIVLAVVIAVLVLLGQFRKQPQPGLTLAESAE
ncbi:CPBP family intramembrane glutamic endopeptidase [Herbiconiux sp. SYSU D00978]|uniref:CPBP family intramembrane glutamic endopeptidase n=1 Tax=Herbiconiux sp. SYSU D00978 TaxID=2812562 RepID=UPI001A965CA7|nr:type II CAAX endopeptidase family protein [Herbiconiux sp. SYSU D00978]